MIINMLEAVSVMLKIDATTQASTERVKCAKIMLDKIIEGMREEPDNRITYEWKAEDQPKPNPPIPPEKSQPEKKKPEPKKKQANEGYELVMDRGKFVMLKGLALDAMVEYNGKKMTHQELIGKSYGEVKIL